MSSTSPKRAENSSRVQPVTPIAGATWTTVAEAPALSPTVQDLYDLLRSEILHGIWPPGAVLSQVKLAQRLGVNRTPLREALRMLQRDGLILSEHNRRVRITSLSSIEMDQLYALRIVQETLALRVSAPRLLPQDFGRLHELLGEMDRHSDLTHYQDWEAFHKEFHFILISHVGDRLESSVLDLMDYTFRYRRAYQELRQDPAGSAEQHAALVRACEDAEFKEASSLLARHLARAALGLIAATDPTYDPVSVREALRIFITE